jgi:hypothetical protein
MILPLVTTALNTFIDGSGANENDEKTHENR